MSTSMQPADEAPDDAAVDVLNNAAAETLKPLGYARKRWIPRRGNNKPVSPGTIHRWARDGVKGVKLAVVYAPGGAVTSEAACREFLAEVDRVRRGEVTAAAVLDATDDELRAVGLNVGVRVSDSK